MYERTENTHLATHVIHATLLAAVAALPVTVLLLLLLLALLRTPCCVKCRLPCLLNFGP